MSYSYTLSVCRIQWNTKSFKSDWLKANTTAALVSLKKMIYKVHSVYLEAPVYTHIVDKKKKTNNQTHSQTCTYAQMLLSKPSKAERKNEVKKEETKERNVMTSDREGKREITRGSNFWLPTSSGIFTASQHQLNRWVECGGCPKQIFFFILIPKATYFDPSFSLSLWFYLCLLIHKLFTFTALIDK